MIIGGITGIAAAYTFAGLAASPYLVLAAMASVGFFSGAFWTALVTHANQSAPPRLRATGQSLIGAAQGGLGWAIGGVTSGVLWDAFGGTTVLLTGAASLLVGVVIFVWGQRQPQSMEVLQ
jgi:predicted MFS family arabinose efflux permease